MLNDTSTVNNVNTEDITLDQVVFTWDEPYEELDFYHLIRSFASVLNGKLIVKKGGGIFVKKSKYVYPLNIKLSEIDKIIVLTEKGKWGTCFRSITFYNKNESDKYTFTNCIDGGDYSLHFDFSANQEKHADVFAKAATEALSKYGIKVEREVR